ncbi:MAG: hypothetical protein L0H79_18140 [Intrasporangium sp.]|uniref:hypothetical protein n=1 Tax=Intrasporangium sp. TaxID=1925024 RepID=UPI00264824E8|nr:hypothetical protein [Intrasporangium sp.]MDN5797647.1 hypothetical protein [Intrasporangium sp.]
MSSAPAGTWDPTLRCRPDAVRSVVSAVASGPSASQTSPWWYLAWLVTLCALAAIAALLKGSEGSTRRRLGRLGAAMLAASVLTYGLAAAGGNSHSVRTYPDGHSVVLIP